MTNINFGGVSGAQLRQFIEKVETLEEEKAQISENIRDIFAEAKAQGFDVKIMRQVMKLRRMKQEDVAEQEELLDLYLHALGMKIEADVEEAA
jgi:uncharacterized protein (UPF0335 family)